MGSPGSGVRYQQTGAVGVLVIDRPSRHNTWSFELEEALFDLAARADADPAIHVIVLTGAGKTFCPGMDVADLARLAAGPGAAARRRPMTYLRELRKLTIAAVNGGCAGIGLLQALCCDIRFAAAEAKFSCAFPRRGAPAEYGSAWLLPRLIGLADAADLLLSGRTITAEYAQRIRLVTEVLPRAELMDGVVAYATDVAANCAPLAIQAAKAQLEASQQQTLDESVAQARAIAHEPHRRPDLAEGAAAFREKRPPRFAPLPPRAPAQ
jgi:enoyl-CoA hydratase/carnithine racemase